MSILICGGSRGIGRAIAVGLAADGTHVFVNYLGPAAEAEESARLIENTGAKATLIHGDIATPEGARKVVAQIAAHTDHIDTIVHCAVKTVSGPVLDADATAFTSAIQVNAMSLVYIVQASNALLRRGSSIVYLSSRGARIALKDYASVGAPKALAEALIRYLAVELAPRGVRINAVSPTAQDTDAFRSIFPDDYQQRLQAAAKASPSGRAVDLDDIVGTVRFLTAPGSEMMQGQVLVLDGANSLVG